MTHLKSIVGGVVVLVFSSQELTQAAHGHHAMEHTHQELPETPRSPRVELVPASTSSQTWAGPIVPR